MKNNSTNLNIIQTGFPFKWYPITEMYRDHLRENTLPNGLSLLNRVNGTLLFIDEGIDCSLLIDNHLVSDTDILSGKYYCQSTLEDIMSFGRQSLSRQIYEAIENSPDHRKEPFLTDNDMYYLFEKDVQNDGEDFEKHLENTPSSEIFSHLAIIKLIYFRLGDAEFADEYLGNLLKDFGDTFTFHEMLELLKIAKLCLEDKNSADKIFALLERGKNQKENIVLLAMAKRYIMQKHIDTSSLLQNCFAATDDAQACVFNTINMAMYFDSNYALDIFRYGRKNIQTAELLLVSSRMIQYFFKEENLVNELLKEAKNKINSISDAVFYLQHCTATGQDINDAYSVLQKYSLIECDDNFVIKQVLITFRYLLQNTNLYEDAVQQILNSDFCATDMLDLAEQLYNYNNYADDLNRIYLKAVNTAVDAEDYIELARWVLEYDQSREKEAGKYLKQADELCEVFDDHIDLANLLMDHNKSKFAEEHIKKAQDGALNTTEFLLAGQAWIWLDNKDMARKCLYKAENTAVVSDEWNDIALAWLDWFDDHSASSRCVENSVELGWQE